MTNEKYEKKPFQFSCQNFFSHKCKRNEETWHIYFLFDKFVFQGLLERLAEGPVIGDGGFVFAMEKRGYVKAGPWTPEVVMEHPEAGIFFYTKTRVKSH